ncbi:MAG: hypothetical protein GC171_03900 [Terrimonas sp.]|nr:hypothetical protein [Terrimonas sp.]
MHRYLLFLVAILLLFKTGYSQKKFIPPIDYELRSVQDLLSKWACKTYFYDEFPGEPFEQSIQVDERSKQIIYRIRDFTAGGTDTSWLATHYIPILLIDSISQNYDDSSLTFFTPYAKIDSWQLDYPAVKNEKVSMHMQLWKVRNLSGQLWGHIRAYQLMQKANQ